MSWKDGLYKVLYTSKDKAGQVGRLRWLEAADLQEKGKARFISNTLYKAAKLGIDITKLNLSEDELKVQIAKVKEKARKSKEKQEKSEKKRRRKRRGKEDEVETIKG